MAKTQGIDPARAVEVIGKTPMAGLAPKAAAGAMLAGNIAPTLPIDLVARDFALALGPGGNLPVTGAVPAVYATAVAEGLAPANITAVVQRYLRR